MKRPFILRPRERRLTLIVVLLIGCWAAVSWLVQPLWDRVESLRRRVQLHTEKLDAIGRLLTQAPSIERAHQGFAMYLQGDKEGRAQSSFLNELESLSRAAKTQLSLKPRPGAQEGRLGGFEVELDVEGSQRDLLAFLDSILQMPRLIAIERLRISAVPAKEDFLRATLIIQNLTLK